MRIILEPTEDQSGREPDGVHPRVAIELPGDELGVGAIMELLVAPALIAWGYQPDNVNDYLNQDQ